MSEYELEQLEAEQKLKLHREYHDVIRLFRYTVVSTEAPVYLANQVDLQVRGEGPSLHFEAILTDAWLYDTGRPSRFLASVRILDAHSIHVQEHTKEDPS